MSNLIALMEANKKRHGSKFPYLSNLWTHSLSIKITRRIFEITMDTPYTSLPDDRDKMLEVASVVDRFGQYELRSKANYQNILKSIGNDYSFVLEAVFFPHMITEDGLVWKRDGFSYFCPPEGWVVSVVMCGYDIPRHARFWYEALPEDFFFFG